MFGVVLGFSCSTPAVSNRLGFIAPARLLNAGGFFFVSASSNHSPKRRRPRIASLSQLHASCRSAATVWLALLELAMLKGGSPVVTPTRKILAKITGIERLPTISAALTALEEAGWIDRVHVPKMVGGVRTATLLRVILHRDRKSFVTGMNTVANGKRSKGRERKSFQDSLRERALPPPTLVGSDAPSSGTETKPYPENETPKNVSLNADGVPADIAALQAELRAKQKEPI
jgi:hypothetical protein